MLLSFLVSWQFGNLLYSALLASRAVRFQKTSEGIGDHSEQHGAWGSLQLTTGISVQYSGILKGAVSETQGKWCLQSIEQLHRPLDLGILCHWRQSGATQTCKLSRVSTARVVCKLLNPFSSRSFAGGIRLKPVPRRVHSSREPNDEAIVSAMKKLRNHQGVNCVALLTEDTDFADILLDLQSSNFACLAVIPGISWLQIRNHTPG